MNKTARMKHLFWTLLLVAVLWPATLLAADAPAVEISADHWQADQRVGVAVYSGNVVITRGTARITADEARLELVNGKLQAATIIGAPATFAQDPADGPPISGQAQRIEYDAANETAVLTGDARVTQGADSLQAASVRINLKTEQIEAHSDQQTPERVHIILHPETGSADEAQP